MHMEMEWVQTLTIIGSILPLTIASVWAFYLITSKRIDKMDHMIEVMNIHHREDMKLVREDMRLMDQKWERLFEKIMITDKKKS